MRSKWWALNIMGVVAWSRKWKLRDCQKVRGRQKASKDLKSCFCSSLDIQAISYSRADLLWDLYNILHQNCQCCLVQAKHLKNQSFSISQISRKANTFWSEYFHTEAYFLLISSYVLLSSNFWLSSTPIMCLPVLLVSAFHCQK